MIRLEVVLKNNWGSPLPPNGAIARNLKRELTQAVIDRATGDDLEIVRVQFMGPKPKPRRSNSKNG